MQKGTVKFFNVSKGFGFITGQEGRDVFVHASALEEEIQENDEVVFELQHGEKGPSALNVRIAE